MEMDSYSKAGIISMYFWVYGKIKWPLVAGLVGMQLFLFMSLFQNLKADPVILVNLQIAIRDLVLIYILKGLTDTLMRVEEMRKKFNESLSARAAERKGRERKVGLGSDGSAVATEGV